MLRELCTKIFHFGAILFMNKKTKIGWDRIRSLRPLVPSEVRYFLAIKNRLGQDSYPGPLCSKRGALFFSNKKSGWQDSNLRPPRPKRGALPSCATSRYYIQFSNFLGAAWVFFAKRLHRAFALHSPAPFKRLSTFFTGVPATSRLQATLA